MIYLSKEELVKNIADQIERASAVIGNTDFSSPKLDPNGFIVPSLGNIVDSAMIVMALELCTDENTDCHRNARRIVNASDNVKLTTKQFIRKIGEIRDKYAFDAGERKFDAHECLDFLNAYDCFMFDFLKTSSTVKNMTADGSAAVSFSSFRNMVEKMLKKAAPGAEKAPSELSAELVKQLERNNELLEKLVEQNIYLNKKVNELTALVRALTEEK